MPAEVLRGIGRRLLVCFAIGHLFFPTATYGRTDLSGSIGGRVLTAEGNPYIVNNDLTVPEGELVTIKEGCTIFFKPFTGIKVEGSIVISGSEEKPVLLSCINDPLSPMKSDQLPNPFDWNGIVIVKKAKKVELYNFSLAYSTQGINAQNEHVKVEKGIFRHSGQYHMTINGMILPVMDGVPFSYGRYSVIYDANGATSGDVPVDTRQYSEGDLYQVFGNTGCLKKSGYRYAGWKQSKEQGGNSYNNGSTFKIGNGNVVLYARWVQGNNSFARKGLPLILGSTGVISGGVSLWYLMQWFEAREQYHTEVNLDKQKALKGDGVTYSSVSIATGTFSILAVSTGIVVAVLNNRDNSMESCAIVAPWLSPGVAGAVVTYNF